MPLLDHFHPPLSDARHWESYHTLWASAIVANLNESVLPAGYFAEAQVHVGSRVEVDVATLEEHRAAAAPRDGAGATLTLQAWAPPAPPLVIPASFPDEIEVQVLGAAGGLNLVAAIELVSPGNKDRTEHRRAFTAKCAAYLQVGIGLLIVDVVTDRLANLHDELITLLNQDDRFRFSPATALYAVAYRPARRDPGGDQLDCWPVALAVGRELPVVPLALRGGPTLPLNLETTYTEARRRSRL
jgi:Protein of unknown function (DUF4058)